MGKYFFLFYYYIGKDFSAFGSQKSSQLSVLLLLGNKIGQCKTQTPDYCLHHANEYVATKVPSFSNTKNNSPQSASYTALKQNLAPNPAWLQLSKKKNRLLSRQCCHNNDLFSVQKNDTFVLESEFLKWLLWEIFFLKPNDLARTTVHNKFQATK